MKSPFDALSGGGLVSHQGAICARLDNQCQQITILFTAQSRIRDPASLCASKPAGLRIRLDAMSEIVKY